MADALDLPHHPFQHRAAEPGVASPAELRQRYAGNPLAAKLAAVEVAIAAVLLRLAYVECSDGIGCPICVLERCGDMFGVSGYFNRDGTFHLTEISLLPDGERADG